MRISRRDTIDRYYLLSWRGWGLFLHRIKRDEPKTYHSHPWTWWSIILGSYIDHRFEDSLGERFFNSSSTVKRFFNSCPAGVPHRVTLRRGPVWTLCLHAPRTVRWAVYGPTGRKLEEEPWRGTENPERTSYQRGE